MQHPARPHHPALHGLRALVVDDDPGCRVVIEQILRYEGALPTSVGTLAAAHEELRERGFPDLVLTDLLLPDGHGLDLVRAIPPLPDAHRVAVVVCTGLASGEERSRARAAGCHAVVEKPFDVNELVLRCRHALDDAARGRLLNTSSPEGGS